LTSQRKTSGLASVELTAIVPGELPDDEGFVPGCGQDHLGVLGVGGDLGNPPEYKSFTHVKHLVTYELYVQWIGKNFKDLTIRQGFHVLTVSGMYQHRFW